MTDTPHRAVNVSSLAILVLAIVILIIAGAMLYLAQVNRTAGTYVQEAEQTSLRMVNFADGRTPALDARYADADGDMVADAPSDAAKLVDPDTLVFSYIAVEDPSAFKDDWSDFTTYLSKAVGKPVTYAPLTHPDDQLRAMRDGRLHVTAFNTGLVPTAVRQAGFVPVSAFGSDAGKASYEIDFIVRPDSGIATPKDFKGKEITLTEIGSNSGYKAPLVLLKREFGLLPFKDYLVRYSGSHDASIVGLAKGDYSAAAVAGDVLQRNIKDGTISPNQFKSIYKSTSFPSAAFGYAHDLKPELAAKVRKALLEFALAGTTVEKRFGAPDHTKLVPISYKDDFAQVREIDDAVGQVYTISEGTTTAPTTAP